MQTYSYHSYAVCSKIVMCLSLATCPAMDNKNTKNKKQKIHTRCHKFLDILSSVKF